MLSLNVASHTPAGPHLASGACKATVGKCLDDAHTHTNTKCLQNENIQHGLSPAAGCSIHLTLFPQPAEKKVAVAIAHHIFQCFTASLPIWINSVGLIVAEEIN